MRQQIPLTHAQQERLAFIDFSLQYLGHISRNDLISRFKTGLAAATRDFAAYKELAPNNMQLDHSNKQYWRTDSFKPVFGHDPEVILTSLSRGFGNGISSGVQPSEQCFDAVRLVHPKPEVIAALMRAIHLRQAVKVEYVSLSSGAGQRELVPHGLVNNGHRWHLRAYDRKHQGFRDFVCTRFIQVEGQQTGVREVETRDYDQAWQQQVTLELVVHPSIEVPQAIEMDYQMEKGMLKLEIRAALAAYLLRQWQVDCSAGHRLKGCQLALGNLAILEQIENLQLAPGANA